MGYNPAGQPLNSQKRPESPKERTRMTTRRKIGLIMLASVVLVFAALAIAEAPAQVLPFVAVLGFIGTGIYLAVEG